MFSDPAPFDLPPDGWFHIAPKGEFLHKPTGLLQVLDDEACRSVATRFREQSAAPNFAGVLIDFDHFSLDGDKPSEAAGWIMDLQERADGLWAKVRWTDRGEQSIRGGRYRFISPVWLQNECVTLESNRVRPTRLVNCALTNDPNMAGLVPLSNSVRPRRLIPVPLFLMNRAVALANGRYLDPKTGQYREWIGGRPWGRGGGRATSAASSRSTTTSSTPAASDDSAPQKIYTTSYRATQARIAEYERQQAELADLKEDPPETRSFDQIDTRELEKTLFRQGYSIPQVKAAVAAAEEQNKQRRLALAAIKKDIRDRVSDPSKRDAELARVLAAIDKDNARRLSEWQADQDKLDAAARKLDAKIAEEKIRAQEIARTAQIRENNATASEASKELEAAARAQVQADKEALRQTAAAAKAQAEAREQLARAAADEAKKSDPAYTYPREVSRRRNYWQALQRGDEDVARRLYPLADHEANRRRLKTKGAVSKSGTLSTTLATSNPVANRRAGRWLANRPAGELTDAQRRAMFARLHAGGGGRHGPASGSAVTREDPYALDPALARRMFDAQLTSQGSASAWMADPLDGQLLAGVLMPAGLFQYAKTPVTAAIKATAGAAKLPTVAEAAATLKNPLTAGMYDLVEAALRAGRLFADDATRAAAKLPDARRDLIPINALQRLHDKTRDAAYRSIGYVDEATRTTLQKFRAAIEHIRRNPAPRIPSTPEQNRKLVEQIIAERQAFGT